MASSSPLRSCSQTLILVHPSNPKRLTALLSRCLFLLILSFQKFRFETGSDRHFVHPCQKHPSKNTAIRFRRKTTSGDPGRSEAWRLHPRMPARKSNHRNRISVVLVPDERLALITLARLVLRRLSNALYGLAVDCRSAKACLRMNSGGKALPIRRATA